MRILQGIWRMMEAMGGLSGAGLERLRWKQVESKEMPFSSGWRRKGGQLRRETECFVSSEEKLPKFSCEKCKRGDS